MVCFTNVFSPGVDASPSKVASTARSFELVRMAAPQGFGVEVGLAA